MDIVRSQRVLNFLSLSGALVERTMALIHPVQEIIVSQKAAKKEVKDKLEQMVIKKKDGGGSKLEPSTVC